MALINCPECGKDISDKAKQCIHCGYPLEEDKPNKENTVNNFTNKTSFNNEKPQTTYKLQNIKSTNSKETIKPPIPPYKSATFVILCLLFAFWFVLIILNIILDKNGVDGIEFLAYIIALGIVSILLWPIFQWCREYKDECELYKLYKEDPVEYQKVKQQQQQQQKQQQQQRRLIEESNKRVTCPYCKSKNTYKISPVSRAISISLTGLASQQIGKQWHCNNCKSDF